jgi:hypothetical protein
MKEIKRKDLIKAMVELTDFFEVELEDKEKK